ncbi:MAG: 3-isopropylmalate dehydratase small subunit [Acidimicrobiia bacterium]|nr:3-isopropylmalate dehydratase small subunit [Acidimicrobiia bacterium]
MKPITTIVGTMAPLPRANVDTDQIMPKQFLKRIERSGFGEFLFYDWARDSEGELDPGFVLNRPEYSDSVVLVTGPNFGSGSSREHAPWGLQDWGFEAVIAPSYADIFRNNCHKIGLLPVVLDQAVVSALSELAAAPGTQITIDLAAQTVVCGDLTAHFEIDEHVKDSLLAGLDHVGATLEHASAIDAFEALRPAFKPSVSQTPTT